MDMIGKVKRLHFRDRISLSEIARRTGLSRNTVKKWVKTPTEVEPRYRRRAVSGKLSAFTQALEHMRESCILAGRLSRSRTRNESYRFAHSSATARKQIKARALVMKTNGNRQSRPTIEARCGQSRFGLRPSRLCPHPM